MTGLQSDADQHRLRLACFVSAVDRFAMPPMLVAIAHDLEVPLAQIVSAASAYFLVYGLMQPLGGILSGRIGLARSIGWGTLLGALATLAACLSGNVLALTVARAVAGAMYSVAIPAALIYVGSTAARGDRHRRVTDLMSGIAFGTALSTALAGATTYLAGWRWAFAVTGIIGILSALYILPLTELPRTRMRDPWIAPVLTTLTNPDVLRLLLLAVLDGAAILGVFTFIPAAIEFAGQNAATAAAVTATYGVAVLVAARIVGRLSRRSAQSTFILAGSAIGAVACGLLVLSVDLGWALSACVLLGIAWASMHTSLQTWSTEVTGPRERTVAVSFFAGALFAGSALAATLAGPLAGQHNFDLIFACGSLLLLAIGIAGYLTRTRWEARRIEG